MILVYRYDILVLCILHSVITTSTANTFLLLRIRYNTCYIYYILYTIYTKYYIYYTLLLRIRYNTCYIHYILYTTYCIYYTRYYILYTTILYFTTKNSLLHLQNLFGMAGQLFQGLIGLVRLHYLDQFHL